MPRLNQNPHLEEMPDHAGPHYDVLRTALMQNGMTEEEAIQQLDNSWTRNHEERIQRWDQQTVDDEDAEEEARRQEEAEIGQRAPQQVEQAQANTDGERRKNKMKDFDDNAVVGSYIAPRPAQYALRRIEDFEYVELWYFTPEGCIDAFQHQHTQTDETFGLTKTDDVVTIKAISAIKASKNVIADADLTFRQMSMAKNTMLPLMSKH